MVERPTSKDLEEYVVNSVWKVSNLSRRGEARACCGVGSTKAPSFPQDEPTLVPAARSICTDGKTALILFLSDTALVAESIGTLRSALSRTRLPVQMKGQCRQAR